MIQSTPDEEPIHLLWKRVSNNIDAGMSVDGL